MVLGILLNIFIYFYSFNNKSFSLTYFIYINDLMFSLYHKGGGVAIRLTEPKL